jgi:phosphotransferase system HPr-like phosphotransfer protein
VTNEQANEAVAFICHDSKAAAKFLGQMVALGTRESSELLLELNGSNKQRSIDRVEIAVDKGANFSRH